MSIPVVSDLLTEEETAVVLRVSRKTLERWRSVGGGPRFVKVGRRVYYRQPTLEEYLTARERSHTTAGAA